MEKEGFSDLFNSQGGKVNLALLFSILIVFLFSILIVEAAWDTYLVTRAPTNLSYNGSYAGVNTRNINFTFNITWIGAAQNVSNCSLWVNDTGITKGWQTVKNVTPLNDSADDRVQNFSGGATQLSYMNYTFSADGNYTFSIGCYENNASGAALNFTASPANRTFFLDTVAPEVVPNFADISTGPPLNITSYETAIIYANVTDNSTRNVFMILYSGASTIAEPTSTNESVNRTMTLNSTLAPDRFVYFANLSGALNFNSSFTSPGLHSVVVCANDSQNRITCSAKKDFVITGMNVTQMENIFGSMQQGITGLSFGGLNITLGNGTELPEGTFMNPIDGVSVGGLTHKNFTFIFNFSANFLVHIVAGRIDEKQFANASNSKINSSPTSEVRSQLGKGYTPNMAWADIASFIPSEVGYEYGIIQIGGTTYSKKLYCNGTTMSAPNCHSINQCNGTVFGIYNYSIVIPPNDGCWLESGTINGEVLRSGFTYTFVDHFSGAVGGEDRGPPNATFFSPSATEANHRLNRSTTVTQLINFTVDDTDSTGLNLSANDSINVTITLGSTIVAFFNYTNSTNPRLQCNSTDTLFPQNTTRITCNTTFAFASNGTYTINITGRDTSNNSNAMNTSTNYVYFMIDQIPPRHWKFNISSNASSDNIDAGDIIGSITPSEVPAGAGGTGAQGRKIVAFANVTDNLTQPFHAALQFYNGSGTWVTINTTKNIDNGVNISNAATNANSSVVLNFTPPTGHNEFEGRNVSFRIIINDTLGNINDSASVINITVNINDTTKPTITINGTIAVNGTNTSNTLPLVSWSVIEGSSLTEINVSVDGVVTDDGCNKFKRFTTTVNQKRNDSFTPTNLASCTLANGTHFIEVRARDTLSNVEVVFHNFTVQSGSIPALIFSNITYLSGAATGINSTVNNTNATSSMGVAFSGLGGSVSIANLTYISSCNTSATKVFTNATTVFPFNESTCPTTSANQTLTITVTDTAGNANTTVFGFVLDNVAPTVTVHNPTAGSSAADAVQVNVSAFDSESQIDTIGYFLDGSFILLNHTINGNRSSGGIGQNTSIINRTVNFTPGTHTIKISVNDTLGNVRNSSVITFTQTGPIRPNEVNSSLNQYLTTLTLFPSNVTVKKKGSAGDFQEVGSSNETDASGTFEIVLSLNSSSTTSDINITVTEINGSGANWAKINFSAFINESTFDANVERNFSASLFTPFVVFNASFEEFMSNRNDYFGVVLLPFNISGEVALAQQIWFFPNASKLSSSSDRVNVSKCTSAFTRTTTTPCWNYTSNGRTMVFVPHFSGVGGGNDSIIPTVNVTTPSTNNTVGSFAPNITVSSDAVSCVYSVNSSVTNVSMTKTGNVCIGTTTNFANLGTVPYYNITFTVNDSSGNVNSYFWNFTVTDSSPPATIGSITSSPSTTSATVTVSANETVNATVRIANGSSISPGNEVDFAASQTVTISGLSASTTYHFNVTICDFNGNCLTNATSLSFTTSAAAAAAAASTSSSGGASGGGAAAPSTEAASTSKKWDSLDAGASAVLTINNANIAVTGVVVDIKNAVTSAEVKVASLSSNPISSAAAGKVYQYLQLTKSNLADSDASKITVNFKVTKAWLSTNSVSEDDVVLYRYSDSKWNALPTSKAGTDANNVMYSAITPGFSTFAIGNKEAAPAAAEQPAEGAPAAETPTVAGEAPAAPEEKPGEAMKKEPVSRTTVAWMIVGVIVLAAGLGYFVWQKKKAE